MNHHKATLTISIVVLLISLAFVQIVRAQPSPGMQRCYSRNYAGISIRIDATQETIPSGNMTASLWINCTADGVHIDYLNLSVYGFRTGKDKTLLYAVSVLNNVSLLFNSSSEYSYLIDVPSDVWETTYGELLFKYEIMDWQSTEYNPGFSMTSVRNVPMEQLQERFNNLTKGYDDLNETYWNLTGDFNQLNQTYWDLNTRYSNMQDTAAELDNARRVAVVLGIAMVFFVATTGYLILRKPRDTW